MTDAVIGVVVSLLLLLLILEPFILAKITIFFEHRKMFETKMTNLNYDQFKELNKQICKNLNLFILDFKIVCANSRVVIKIRKNYFEFFKKDNSLIFLFSEETMLKAQLQENIKYVN